MKKIFVMICLTVATAVHAQPTQPAAKPTAPTEAVKSGQPAVQSAPASAPTVPEIAEPTPPPAPVIAPEPAPAPAPKKTPEPVLAPLGKSTTEQSPRVNSVPSLQRPEPISFNARLGVGSSFGPQALWFDSSIEVQLDKFVAFGPKLQYGTNDTTDFMFASIGPRFTIPFSYFEFGINGGFGFAYRNPAGFEFTNFLYEAGINFDFYLLENMSLGLGYNVNFLSANAETFMSALVFAVTGHF